MTIEFRIEERSAQPAMSIRDRSSIADLPKLFDRAFGSVLQRLGALGEQPAGPPFAYYHNLDMENLDVEVGFPTAHEVEGSGEIRTSMLPGGRYCTGVHVGRYEQLPEAWEAAMTFAAEQGQNPDEFAIEFYLTNPTEVAPDENQTQILLPLKEG